MSATAAPRIAAGPANRARRRSAASREVTVFRVAMALILLAVADDAFGHPEPGTGAADHLAGGLVPLAIGVGLALCSARRADTPEPWRPSRRIYERCVIGFFDRTLR